VIRQKNHFKTLNSKLLQLKA